MQPRILLRKFSQFSKSPITQNPSSLGSVPLLPFTHFSSIPNSPMSGNPRTDEEASEDNFLRNLNLGSQANSDNAPKLHANPIKMREENDEFNQNLSSRNQSGDTLFGKVGQTEPLLTKYTPENADEIFKKMKETGLIPNAVAMLDGLCKDGLAQEALKLFGLMREKGAIPEVVAYTAVVEGYCKAAKFDDAKRIFRKMQKNGIVPNAFSYGVLIKGLCGGRRLEDAVEFCREMLDAGHLPNAATVSGLVTEFCVEKGVEAAAVVVRGLREKGAIDDKAVREHLDKRGTNSPMVWEAFFG